MIPLYFVGQIPASKSLLNRALIVKSFFPHLEIDGNSSADDVRHLKSALVQMQTFTAMDCGEAGTALRFLALRAARIQGTHRLIGSIRLFQRPQTEIQKILGQLGCDVAISDSEIKIKSWGWKMVGDALHVPMDRSSQFASAVILSAWQLPYELCLLLGSNPASKSYLDMTLGMVRQLGMEVSQRHREIRIPPHQMVRVPSIKVEPDMSSAFAMAAAAGVAGRASMTGMPEQSLQPDFRFIRILREMGITIAHEAERLEVQKANRLLPIHVDLGESSDLFPVLAALAALADGESHLRGAGQLVFKESNRIAKTAELLRLVGRSVKEFSDGLVIFGRASRPSTGKLDFDPDQDHRMAMAAAILKLAGEPLTILHSDVVNKSFPEFWQNLGPTP